MNSPNVIAKGKARLNRKKCKVGDIRADPRLSLVRKVDGTLLEGRRQGSQVWALAAMGSHDQAIMAMDRHDLIPYH